MQAVVPMVMDVAVAVAGTRTSALVNVRPAVPRDAPVITSRLVNWL